MYVCAAKINNGMKITNKGRIRICMFCLLQKKVYESECVRARESWRMVLFFGNNRHGESFNIIIIIINNNNK